MVEKKIFPVGINNVYFKNGMSSDSLKLYTKCFSSSDVDFLVVHDYGLQEISICGSNFKEVDINRKQAHFNIELKPGIYQLHLPKQNVIIKTQGYFAFTPESFFLPQRCEVVNWKNDLDWLKDNADYIVINFGDYTMPVEDNGWLIAQANWEVEDLFISDNKLYFCLKAPHLNEEPYRTIPVDWIEINLEIPPLNERFSVLGHSLYWFGKFIRKSPID